MPAMKYDNDFDNEILDREWRKKKREKRFKEKERNKKRLYDDSYQEDNCDNEYKNYDQEEL